MDSVKPIKWCTQVLRIFFPPELYSCYVLTTPLNLLLVPGQAHLAKFVHSGGHFVDVLCALAALKLFALCFSALLSL